MTAGLGDLTLGADQPATGRMLVRQQRCMVICLFALDEEAAHCNCRRCDGAFHGSLSYLLDRPVDGSARRLSTSLPGDSDEPALFDVTIPAPAGAPS